MRKSLVSILLYFVYFSEKINQQQPILLTKSNFKAVSSFHWNNLFSKLIEGIECIQWKEAPIYPIRTQLPAEYLMVVNFFHIHIGFDSKESLTKDEYLRLLEDIYNFFGSMDGRSIKAKFIYAIVKPKIIFLHS
jgi:hypothetical protein